MRKIPFVVLLLIGACAADPVVVVHQDVKDGPGALARFVGDWTCTGSYLDVPPFSFAHPLTADFRVTSDGVSILGAYRETSPTVAPLTIADQLTATSASGGERRFHDSSGGEEVGNYTLLNGINGSLHLDFTGVYSIFGLQFPFDESLDLAADSSTFSLSADIVGHTFQTQTCVRAPAARTVTPSNAACPRPDSFCNWRLSDADSWCSTLCGRPAFCGFVEESGDGHCIQRTATLVRTQGSAADPTFCTIEDQEAGHCTGPLDSESIARGAVASWATNQGASDVNFEQVQCTQTSTWRACVVRVTIFTSIFATYVCDVLVDYSDNDVNISTYCHLARQLAPTTKSSDHTYDLSPAP